MTKIKLNSVDELRTYYLESCKFLNVEHIVTDPEFPDSSVALHHEDPDLDEWELTLRDIVWINKTDNSEETEKAVASQIKKWGINPNRVDWTFLCSPSWTECFYRLVEGVRGIRYSTENYREYKFEHLGGHLSINVGYYPKESKFNLMRCRIFYGRKEAIEDLFFHCIEDCSAPIYVIERGKEDEDSESKD